jgi:predicted N-acyltransferase
LRTAAITAEVVSPHTISGEEVDSLSSRAGIHFSRARLEWLWEDARWLDMLAAVRCGGRLAGLLPIAVCRAPEWYDPLYDVSELTGDARLTPSGTCLIAGRGDVRGSMLFDPDLDQRERREVADRAVQAALHFARRRRLRCAALYVSAVETELSAMLGSAGLTPRPAPSRHVIRWPEPTIDSYFASLSAVQRKNVRGDWRTRDKLGLEICRTSWESVIEPAAPMINYTLVNHGYQSRHELVSMRLRRWSALVGDNGFALYATAAGKCTGYAFCWRDGDRVNVHDTAFNHGSGPADRASYLQLLIHGPVTACCELGLSKLDLGIYADEPKRLRGAAEERIDHWVQQEDW